MESAVERLKCATSPMARFPVEVLLRIFRIMVDQAAELRRTQARKRESRQFDRVLVTLGHVCSEWRMIINQSTTLWEHVTIRTYITASPWVAEERIRMDARMAQWMKRGLHTDKQLFIDRWRVLEAETIKAIVGSKDRPWKSLEIAVSTSDPSIEWDVRAISARSVTLYRAKSSLILESFVPLLRYAVTISIMGTPPNWGNTPWSSLLSLHIRPFVKSGGPNHLNFGLADLRDLLNAAPYLKNLELDFTIDIELTTALNETMDGSMEHTRLNSLSMHLHHLDIYGRPFGIPLSTPSLHSLKVLSLSRRSLSTGVSANSTWENVTSVAFSTLEEHDVPIAVSFLHQFSNLTSLDVQGPHIDKLFTLINAFYHHVPPQYATLPASKLTKVIFDGTDIQGETLIALVERRLAQLEGGIQGILAITEVDLYESPGVTPADWKRVNELLELGQADVKDFAAGDVEMKGR